MFTGHHRTWRQVNFVMSSGAGFMGSPGQSAWHVFDGGVMGVGDPQVTLAESMPSRGMTWMIWGYPQVQETSSHLPQ